VDEHAALYVREMLDLANAGRAEVKVWKASLEGGHITFDGFMAESEKWDKAHPRPSRSKKKKRGRGEQQTGSPVSRHYLSSIL
jgi:hypothetical protein